MFKFTKLFSLLVASIFLFSCSEEFTKNAEKVNEKKFNYGDYMAISMVSNSPIDANFDGNYSTDFLNEFLSYSLTTRSSFKFYALENNKSGLKIVLQTMERWPPEYKDDTTNILNLITFSNISNGGFKS